MSFYIIFLDGFGETADLGNADVSRHPRHPPSQLISGELRILEAEKAVERVV